MRNLVMHCGANNVTEADVRAVPTPAGTKTHFPIPHGLLLDRTIDMLKSHGLEVVNAAHALHSATPKDGSGSTPGNRYFGLLEIAHEGGHHLQGTDYKPDYATVIGLRNSHDKTFPAGLVCGSQVFVCDNLAFSGEVKMARKHTRRIMDDLPQLLERAMGKLNSLRGYQDHRIQMYKDTGLNRLEAHDLLIRGMQAGIVPASKLPKVVAEWEKPSHEEFEDRTVWSMFNAFTEVLKTRGALFDKPRYTQALHGLMDGASNVQPLRSEVEADAEIVLN